MAKPQRVFHEDFFTSFEWILCIPEVGSSTFRDYSSFLDRYNHSIFNSHPWGWIWTSLLLELRCQKKHGKQGKRGIMDWGEKSALRMARKDFFRTRRVIEDRIPSLTPDNDILHQFKASSAAGGMIISIIIPRELIMIITPLGMKLWILSSLPASTAVSWSG